ncbi:hypothetical protein JQ604_11615 [Bradyrhizobium jicamae]|uniref:hypothetical protein n=1 Tax=Bradyrhizobium jicamae TaxID=280332 RepID=UPI001BAA9E79|nr:hypothetical protein [Bradyrhizobium jicamae]MBR0752833.1 hypothetical protein [Bradyrhizobium jicamae]
MRVNWNDLQNTFEFVSLGQPGEHEAVLCRESGQLLWHSELVDDLDEWPDDADDEEKYVSIPHRKELDLGKQLVLDFVEESLPDDFEDVRRMFKHKGAYGRFKDLLQQRNALDRWYAFETKATEKALREWCDVNDVVIDDGATSGT